MDNSEQNSHGSSHTGSSVHLSSHGQNVLSNLWQRVKSPKFLKFGLPLLLVALLPVVIFLARQQQDIQSRASAATTLSFTPGTTDDLPVEIDEGDEVELGIKLDPGINAVSVVDLVIYYDVDYFELADPSDFKVDRNIFPEVINQEFLPGEIWMTLLIGNNFLKAVRDPVEIATLKLQALASTEEDIVYIEFGEDTQVLSLGDSDNSGENVLSLAQPAVVEIKSLPEAETLDEEPTPTSRPASFPTEKPLATPTTKATPTAKATPVALPEIDDAICSSLRADINEDELVNYEDQEIAESCMDTDIYEDPWCEASDINENGFVDIVDLNCILRGGRE